MLGIDNERKFMSVQDAGKIGGRRLVEKYGREHFVELGHKSGSALRDAGFDFKEMAKKGGKATAATHDSDYYSELGKQGGDFLKEKVDKEYPGGAKAYYQDIGAKGAAAKKKKS